ncbi:hypothetical protein D6D25_06140 [Aureobasidium pullulans]|nr:hypothetical protein D6D25_06140 [Aureobasidium pullulans]
MSTLAFFADMSAGAENLTTGVPGDSPSVPSLTRSTYGTFKPSKPQATTTKYKGDLATADSPAINKKCDHATETWFSRLFGWESYHLTMMKSMGMPASRPNPRNQSKAEYAAAKSRLTASKKKPSRHDREKAKIKCEQITPNIHKTTTIYEGTWADETQYSISVLNLSSLNQLGHGHHIAAPFRMSFTCTPKLRNDTNIPQRQQYNLIDNACIATAKIFAEHKSILGTKGKACDCDIHWLRTGKTARGGQGCGEIGERKKKGGLMCKAYDAMAEHDRLCSCGCFDTERKESEVVGDLTSGYDEDCVEI